MFACIRVAHRGTVIEPCKVLARSYSSTAEVTKDKNRNATANQYLKPTTRLLNKKLKEEQDLKKERNKLAVSSLKDIFSIFSPSGGDDEELDLSNFDPKPVYENPPSFLDLPYHKQQYMIDTVNERMKKRWGGINPDVKRFVYWLSYGSYGPREGFPNFYDYLDNSNKIDNNKETSNETSEAIGGEKDSGKANNNDAMDKLINDNFIDVNKKARIETIVQGTKKNDVYIPIDLPFKTPPILKTSSPAANTRVSKLPELNPRTFGKIRSAQFQNDKKMDPYSRFIIATLIVLTILNLKRDRKVNSTNVAPVYDFGKDLGETLTALDKEAQEANKKLEELMEAKEGEGETKASKKRGRRWYYMWLY